MRKVAYKLLAELQSDVVTLVELFFSRLLVAAPDEVLDKSFCLYARL